MTEIELLMMEAIVGFVMGCWLALILSGWRP